MKIRCELWPVAGSKKKKKQNNPSLSLKKVYISPTWGDAPREPIATKFGNSLYLTEVIDRSKFGVDWFSSFGSGEVQNLRFAIGTASGPYHCSAAALTRDTTSGMILKKMKYIILSTISALETKRVYTYEEINKFRDENGQCTYITSTIIHRSTYTHMHTCCKFEMDIIIIIIIIINK